MRIKHLAKTTKKRADSHYMQVCSYQVSPISFLGYRVYTDDKSNSAFSFFRLKRFFDIVSALAIAHFHVHLAYFEYLSTFNFEIAASMFIVTFCSLSS